MKTTTETEYLYPEDWRSLELLVQRLGEIKAKTNQFVSIRICGSGNMGYRIECSWERPMTEEEVKRHDRMCQKAEESCKEARRAQYLKLKEEFENE